MGSTATHKEQDRSPHQADRELVRRARAGDAAAQETLLERLRCVSLILEARNRRLGGPLGREDLADLIQDVLMVVWRKLDGFAGRSTLESWVFGICSLEIMNAMRARRRRPPTTDAGARLAAPATREPPRGFAPADLQGGLVELGPPAEDVIRLKHFQQLTFAEIGARLDLSPNTVKAQYYRGLRRLRQILEPDEEPT